MSRRDIRRYTIQKEPDGGSALARSLQVYNPPARSLRSLRRNFYSTLRAHRGSLVHLKHTPPGDTRRTTRKLTAPPDATRSSSSAQGSSGLPRGCRHGAPRHVLSRSLSRPDQGDPWRRVHASRLGGDTSARNRLRLGPRELPRDRADGRGYRRALAGPFYACVVEPRCCVYARRGCSRREAEEEEEEEEAGHFPGGHCAREEEKVVEEEEEEEERVEEETEEKELPWRTTEKRASGASGFRGGPW
ncbi:hypothetical protein KM043_006513 [Ampulex compressa]|nr:hypothetical protein KM043_006513 [Ampulex compressa]